MNSNEILKKMKQVEEKILSKCFDKLDSVRNTLKKNLKPDRYYITDGGIAGHYPGICVVHDLTKQPYPRDAWNGEIKQDVIKYTDYTKFEGLVEGGLGLFSFEKDAFDFLMNKEHNFYDCSEDEQEKAIRELEKYMKLDIDDYRDCPRIACMFPLWIKDDSPDEKWNEEAKILLNEYNELKDTLEQIAMANVNEAIALFDRLRKKFFGSGISISFHKVDETMLSVEIVNETRGNSYSGKEEKFYVDKNTDMLKLTNYIEMLEKELMEKIQSIEKNNSLIRNGNLPLLKVIDKGKGVTTNFYIKNGEILEIPKSLFGIVIGKNGSTIKKIRRLLNMNNNLKLVESNDSDKWNSNIRFRVVFNVEDLSDFHIPTFRF